MATKNGTSGDDELEGTINDDVIHGLGGDDDFSGGANDDDLFGDDGDDFLKGGRGEDRLFGGAGDDDLIGGPEGDRLDGGAGIDTVSYSGADGVTADLTTGFGSGDDASQDIYISIENLFGSVANDVLIGNAEANEIDGSGGDDRISGGDGADWLYAGGGTDRLQGDAGRDRLSGKGGADTYVYAAVGDTAVGAATRDLIIDFSKAEGDRIDLSQRDAAAGLGGNQAFTFIGAASFSSQGQVRVLQSGGNTFVNINTSGASGAEAQIEIAGLVTLVAADFVL